MTAPVIANPAERDALERVGGLFQADESTPTLVGPDGESIELPASLYAVLRQVVPALLDGQAVSIAPVDQELTTNQAADLLNVSRPYLIKVLERGDLPFHMVGTHRRMRLGDVLDYQAIRDARRREALAELARESQRLGLYDNE